MKDYGLASHLAESSRKCYIVPVAMRCNARCTFCATHEYKPRAQTEFMDAQGVESRISRLVAAGAVRFEVTGGGEPTLHSDLGSIICSIRRAGGQYIKLYTNCSRLPGGLAVDELNISRAHFDPDRNQKIMHIAGGSESLAATVTRARGGGYRNIRLSVPLVHGGIDSPEEASAFVRSAAGLVGAVVFRPLYPATPDRESILPDVPAHLWQRRIEELADEFRESLVVEFDAVGCFRGSQAILASDLRLYGDWSLSRRIAF